MFALNLNGHLQKNKMCCPLLNIHPFFQPSDYPLYINVNERPLNVGGTGFVMQAYGSNFEKTPYVYKFNRETVNPEIIDNKYAHNPALEAFEIAKWAGERKIGPQMLDFKMYKTPTFLPYFKSTYPAYSVSLMEFIPGAESLSSENVNPIVCDKLKDMLTQMKQNNIVHSDLHQFNILVNRNTNDVRIIDWNNAFRVPDKDAKKLGDFGALDVWGIRSLCKWPVNPSHKMDLDEMIAYSNQRNINY